MSTLLCIYPGKMQELLWICLRLKDRVAIVGWWHLFSSLQKVLRVCERSVAYFFTDLRCVNSLILLLGTANQYMYIGVKIDRNWWKTKTMQKFYVQESCEKLCRCTFYIRTHTVKDSGQTSKHQCVDILLCNVRRITDWKYTPALKIIKCTVLVQTRSFLLDVARHFSHW